MIHTPQENRALRQQVIGALPVPNIQPLAFESYELPHALARGGRRSDTIAAAYMDYYGQTMIRFNDTDDMADGRSGKEADITRYDVPRSEWDKWNVVLSGSEVYVEPVETTQLEPGAVAQPAGDCISEHLAALSDTEVTPKVAAEHLRMLGRLPFKYAGLTAVWLRCVQGLKMEQSEVELYRKERAMVVHTPRGSMWTSPRDSRQMTLQAQAAGALESVRFYSDGDYRPVGMTNELRYGREGIAYAQAKYLRRHAVGL